MENSYTFICVLGSIVSLLGGASVSHAILKPDLKLEPEVIKVWLDFEWIVNSD